MSGAFGNVPMRYLRGAYRSEDFGVSSAGRGEPRLDIGAKAIGNMRQRYPINVGSVGVERHAIVRVGQLLQQRGEAEVTRRLAAQRVVQAIAAGPSRARSEAVVVGA